MDNFKSEEGKYYIDGKEVTEKTYISMLEEKISRQNISIPTFNLKQNQEEQQLHEDYQEILEFIQYLNEIHPEEAIQEYNQMVFDISYESFLQGVIHAYNEIGGFAHKVARCENQLEDMSSGEFET